MSSDKEPSIKKVLGYVDALIKRSGGSPQMAILPKSSIRKLYQGAEPPEHIKAILENDDYAETTIFQFSI